VAIESKIVFKRTAFIKKEIFLFLLKKSAHKIKNYYLFFLYYEICEALTRKQSVLLRCIEVHVYSRPWMREQFRVRALFSQNSIEIKGFIQRHYHGDEYKIVPEISKVKDSILHNI
jgi:hypothetical protein